MPTKVENFSLWKMTEAFVRALKTIDQADGYNTTPKVQLGARLLSSIPAGEFPHLAVEMGDITPDAELLGQPSQGRIRYEWPAFVWGYVKASGGRAALYEAGSALLVDVFGALWANETLPDGNGQGTALFINPAPITFDMESFATENQGFFLAEFRLVADVTRGSAP